MYGSEGDASELRAQIADLTKELADARVELKAAQSKKSVALHPEAPPCQSSKDLLRFEIGQAIHRMLNAAPGMIAGDFFEKILPRAEKAFPVFRKSALRMVLQGECSDGVRPLPDMKDNRPVQVVLRVLDLFETLASPNDILKPDRG